MVVAPRLGMAEPASAGQPADDMMRLTVTLRFPSGMTRSMSMRSVNSKAWGIESADRPGLTEPDAQPSAQAGRRSGRVPREANRAINVAEG